MGRDRLGLSLPTEATAAFPPDRPTRAIRPRQTLELWAGAPGPAGKSSGGSRATSLGRSRSLRRLRCQFRSRRSRRNLPPGTRIRSLRASGELAAKSRYEAVQGNGRNHHTPLGVTAPDRRQRPELHRLAQLYASEGPIVEMGGALEVGQDLTPPEGRYGRRMSSADHASICSSDVTSRATDIPSGWPPGPVTPTFLLPAIRSKYRRLNERPPWASPLAIVRSKAAQVAAIQRGKLRPSTAHPLGPGPRAHGAFTRP